MKIIYENTDISKNVQVRHCIVRDTAGERCDSLELEMEDAGKWFRWEPKRDDRIRVTHQDYDAGEMYLHSILPADGRFLIRATALPCAARNRIYRSYTGKTLEEIMSSCGASSGMGSRIYGLDGKTKIPYVQQEDESCAAFLSRLLRMEGAELKCVDGRLTAIGILYAQERNAHQTIRLSADQAGIELQKTGEKARTLTVRTPFASCTASDEGVSVGIQILRNDLPARTRLPAGRWARGLLLAHNRRCETLCLQSEFNQGFTAMTRIDVTGGTAMDGNWLIADAEHDLIEGTSKVRMHRCISTIR